MSENKPLGFFKDNVGDNSSKRLVAFILMFFGMGFAIAGLVLKARGIDAENLVKFVFSLSVGSALVALGLTLPEVLFHK
jgi:hypothetical protein